MRQLGPTDLKRLHRSWQRRTDQRLAVLLDGVQNPFNVGSIVRTAAALRVEHLYLGGPSVSPGHAKAGKTAMGTERYLTWSEHATTAAAIEQARVDGFFVLGLELADGAVPLHELVLPPAGGVCLAVGHEDHGLSGPSLGACDAVAFIPQLGRVGSLNVAMATGMALYELRRRTWEAQSRSGPEGVDLDAEAAGRSGD
ncbi:MAG TPA: TrmH family RNA methyltransferase [Acidimicrobiales bacterium]|jgi:tRNA (guanosine-2'-O-)-methyltransferase